MAEESRESGLQPPKYIFLETLEREQFLSEVGNFTPVQREIFHDLCKIYHSPVPLGRFVAQVSNKNKNGAQELDKLLERLSEKRYAVVTVRCSVEKEERDRIVLTERAERTWYYFQLQNELERFHASRDYNLPVESKLKAKNLQIPPDFCTLVRPEDLVPAVNATQTGNSIFCMRLQDGDLLFLLANGWNRFINTCLARLKAALGNPNLLGELARLRKTTLADIKQRIESKDPLMWSDLTKSILQMRNDTLLQNKVVVDPTFFQTAHILLVFIEGQLAEIRKKKIEREERERDSEAVAIQIEQAPAVAVTQEKLVEVLSMLRQKYGESYEEFRQVFQEVCLSVRERVGLPLLVQIGKFYIHRSNIYPWFQKRMATTAGDLANEYLQLMEEMLKTNNRDRNTTFLSRENLDQDIEQRVKQMDPFLGALFAKPRILSESIIHFMKEVRNSKDLAAIKFELERYLVPETMTLVSYTALFGISAINLFETAFTRLGFIRQIIIRFTGRYESYKEQFLGGAGSAARKVMQSGGSKLQGSKERDASGRMSSLPVQRSGSKPAAARTTIKPKPKPPNPKYTPKQQEQAWSEFGRSIKPKP